MPLSIFSLARRLLPVTLLASLAWADPPPFQPNDTEDYDFGKYGRYPELKFKTSDLVAPRTLLREWGPHCRTGEHIFICPRGFFVGHKGPMILDDNGQMVWHNEIYGTAYGLTVQNYRGNPYLTFWTGNDQVIGHGQGVYYMYDNTYRQYKKIDAIGDIMGDLHEFKITEQDTVMLTSYEAVRWNLTDYGRDDPESYIWDCIFQEVDIETNQLLFSWRASEHFTFEDCYNPRAQQGPKNNPWDWFHINSISKDPKGNYLISARYSHSLSYIDGVTGKVLWEMGGKHNNFTDLSDGKATNFAWQHDARWVDDYKAITLFDNAAYWGDMSATARGLKIAVDLNGMTAKLLADVSHPQHWVSESQGSAQQLTNGNLLLGYGSSSAVTEFKANGEIACDMQFGALHDTKEKNGDRSPGTVMSYRAYRHEWHGYPHFDPSVKFDEGSFYVSWNGATEVRTWQLEGTNAAGSRERDWKLVGRFEKQGFESNMKVNVNQYQTYRLTALTGNKQHLGSWIVYPGGEIRAIPLTSSGPSSLLLIFIGAMLTFAVVLVLRRRAELSARIMLFVREVFPRDGRRPQPTLRAFRLLYRDEDDIEKVSLVRED